MSLFKKSKPAVRVLEANDWLLNLIDYFNDWIKELGESKNASIEIVIFSQLYTVRDAKKLLLNFPGLIDVFGELMLELRLYYDCCWQIYFLENGSDRDKVSKFYADVKATQDGSYQNIFKNNPSIEKLIGDVLYKHNSDEIKSANDCYILNKIPEDFNTMMDGEEFDKMMDDMELDRDIFIHAHKFWFRLLQKGVDFGPDFHIALTLQVYENTLKINNDELLSNFNIDKTVSFPDEFYELD